MLNSDASGNVASVADALNRSISFAYDVMGRVTNQTLPDGGTLSYTYDGTLPLNETWAGAVNGHVSMAYDPRYEFNKVVNRYHGDKREGSMSCWAQFCAMFYGRLSGRKSLKEISLTWESHRHKPFNTRSDSMDRQQKFNQK